MTEGRAVAKIPWKRAWNALTEAGGHVEGVRGQNDADLSQLQEAVKNLETRTHKTYLARIKAYERLTQRNNAWNASLMAFATSATVASVGLLVDSDMYGQGGEALLVALSILSLVASLVVSNVNYGARARAMEVSYKRIQQISVMAEGFFFDELPPTRQRYLELSKEYGIAIESSENHLTSDYLRSQGRSGTGIWKDTAVTFMPYATLTVPLVLLVPFVNWFFAGI